MTNARNTATIIIPQRGNQHLTERLVSQIVRHEPRHSIIVVDDGHATPDAATGPIGQAETIENFGEFVTAAWNCGVESSQTDWVILLNNDVVCNGPFVDSLIAAAGDGISGARIRHDPDAIECVLEGWCLCFDRLLFNLLGGFDPAMKLYFSDTDFQVRCRRAGYQLRAVEVPLVHLGHQTAHNRRLMPNRGQLWAADRDAFLRKHGVMKQAN